MFEFILLEDVNNQGKTIKWKKKNGNRIIANYINEVRKIKQNQKLFRFKKKKYFVKVSYSSK